MMDENMIAMQFANAINTTEDENQIVQMMQAAFGMLQGMNLPEENIKDIAGKVSTFLSELEVEEGSQAAKNKAKAVETLATLIG
ncbi:MULTISPECIES: hypothetical protein [Flammeovirga]|uniref:Uncharacterized protein n=3 Tax=Flammeovirga TaxID=59739 RepID=A0A7X9P067_9BACT|nr:MULTISPECIES: hypothetical protein [Flammeovirga]MBD0400389.1 hypothetical protein [Flammeovirga sp. EKP202]NME66905.1 hypothetical protein [Flammeovirga aprica JL-4]